MRTCICRTEIIDQKKHNLPHLYRKLCFFCGGTEGEVCGSISIDNKKTYDIIVYESKGLCLLAAHRLELEGWHRFILVIYQVSKVCKQKMWENSMWLYKVSILRSTLFAEDLQKKECFLLYL